MGVLGGVRGLYLGNDDLFVCTWAECPSPPPAAPPSPPPPPAQRFPSSNTQTSCSFPSGDPPPGRMAPGSGSDLGFGSERRWSQPATASQDQPRLLLNERLGSLEQREQVAADPQKAFIPLFFYEQYLHRNQMCCFV